MNLPPKELADKAKTIREDEVLNSIRTAVIAILRTNFFGTKQEGNFGNQSGLERVAVAYKIDSAIPISLPPCPYREIFCGILILVPGIHFGEVRLPWWFPVSQRPSDL